MILEPTIKVECNCCERQDEYDLTALAGGCWDTRNLDRQMKRDGWITKGDDEHVCIDCGQDADA